MHCDTPAMPVSDLDQMLASLPAAASPHSLGPDIDEANRVLLDPAAAVPAKITRFRQWASRFQPCMFGRMGARGLAGIHYDVCWIDRAALHQGSAQVRRLIQRSRQAWKERAANGLSHGFLVMFNATELAYARPGLLLLQLCRKLCDLFLVEHAPVSADTIYTESLPFHADDGTVSCLKGGINVFYGGAHRTSNHDRRIPGGVMISVNSPGLLAHSLVKRGMARDLGAALDAVRTLAWASIGNGGVSRGRQGESSCSWHNIDSSRAPGECPMKHRPVHVPGNFAKDHYSALYHTDVLLPSRVMLDNAQDRPRGTLEVWPRLDLEYISASEHAEDHENFGFVHGERVAPEACFQHAWAPRPVPAPATKEQLS
jgi:hypothetical protein